MTEARDPQDVIFMISMAFSGGEDSCVVLALRPTNFVPQKQKYQSYQLVMFDEEFEMLDRFFEMIREEDPDVIIGYNIMGFDMKYIMQKYYSLLRNIPQAGRSEFIMDKIVHKSWKTAAYGSREYTIFDFKNYVFDKVVDFRIKQELKQERDAVMKEDTSLSLAEVVNKINEPLPKPVYLEYEKNIDKMLIFTKKKYVYRIG
ncbi:DNA-directed DNA polymerase delta, partial [Coemansia sp. RSA 1853]